MFHRKPGQISPKSNPALHKSQQTSDTTGLHVLEKHSATLIQRAKTDPRKLSADEVLKLQSAIGNRAVTQLLANRGGHQVQAKLTIGQPGDKYEQEADRVAHQVVRQMNEPASQPAGQGESVQREVMEDEELMMKPEVSTIQREEMPNEEELQIKPMGQRQFDSGMSATPDLEAAINQARSSGQPLVDNTREPMEQLFGADFSRVRVHTDAQSNLLNQSIQARAFTTGQDIFFRQGQYNTTSQEGQELLAHELTHVVQQSGNGIQRQEKPRIAHLEPKPQPEMVQLEAMENKNDLIQRKVYIKRNPLGRHKNQYRTKIKSRRSDQGEGDRKVEDMLADNVARYFDSKDELFQYARKGTETIGYVNKDETWIRINSNQLLVLGEDHTETTLADIVKAVGTKKFMYEAYTETPQKLMGNEQFVEAVNQRKEEFNQKLNTDNKGKFRHEAESFYPKVLRGFSTISCDSYTHSLNAGGSERYYLRLAILATATLSHKNSQLYQHYQNNKDLFDETANQLRTNSAGETELSKKMEEQNSSEIFDIFRDAFTSYANEEIKQEEQSAASEDRENFQEKWHLSEKDYSRDEESPIIKAEKARDFSMYQHIKQAREQGYLLYGFGELHRKRLKELLNKKGIQNTSIDDFLETQKKEYPQT